ncbi:hypothetical protein D7024_10865 [Desulfofundulus salinus]|uniref:Delta-aminolevulinic acid dehydratase n=2 Tax=Desulfofundulus salinus TaxID=2419843 RepID=A0A494X3J3_9FIRM|nr:hypothetical protein D7024_10865 [Desulfofundulus salinum]
MFLRSVLQDYSLHNFKMSLSCLTQLKYASAFYGLFREAADSAPKFGDRRSYQMAPQKRARGIPGGTKIYAF